MFWQDGTRRTSCGNYFTAEKGNNKVIDTEIEVIARENVGTLDIVVTTTTVRNGFDLAL